MSEVISLQKTDPISLKYRPFIHRLYAFAILGLVLSEMVIIRQNLPAIAQDDWMGATLKIVLASTVVIGIFFRLVFYVRPWIFSDYQVFEDRLVIRHGKKQKELLLSEIRQVKLSWLPPRWFGGFYLRFKSGQNLMFLSLLKNNHLLFQKVIDLHGDLMEPKKAEAYIRNSRWVETSWQRMRDRMRDWRGWPLQYFVTPLIVTLALHRFGPEWLLEMKSSFSNLYFSVFASCLVLGFILNSVEERIWLSGLDQDSKELSRDLARERNLQMWVKAAYFLVITAVTLGVIVVS